VVRRGAQQRRRARCSGGIASATHHRAARRRLRREAQHQVGALHVPAQRVARQSRGQHRCANRPCGLPPSSADPISSTACGRATSWSPRSRRRRRRNSSPSPPASSPTSELSNSPTRDDRRHPELLERATRAARYVLVAPAAALLMAAIDPTTAERATLGPSTSSSSLARASTRARSVCPPGPDPPLRRQYATDASHRAAPVVWAGPWPSSARSARRRRASVPGAVLRSRRWQPNRSRRRCRNRNANSLPRHPARCIL
jgi:hypothetical protein